MSYDLAVDSPAPACESGYPEAVPLADSTPLKVSVPGTGFEGILPVLLALDKGEFEAENLDVELIVLPASESLPALSRGNLDIACSAPTASVFNAISQGFDVRWINAAYYDPADNNTSGLYVKNGTTVADLEGATIASGAAGGPSDYPLAAMFAEEGFGLADVTFTTLPAPADNKRTALDNDVVKAVTATNTEAVLFSDEKKYTNLGPITLSGEPYNFSCFAGPTVIIDDRAAGVAFERAYSRVINTYLQGDYKADPEVLSDIARVMEVPEEAVTAYPSLTWDWLPREGTVDRLQKAWRERPDILQYDTDLTEAQVVDRSLVGEAHGVTFPASE
jgi:NitT/TauT family transport system substrate-binding protein